MCQQEGGKECEAREVEERKKDSGGGSTQCRCQGFGGSAWSLGLVFPTKEPLRVI